MSIIDDIKNNVIQGRINAEDEGFDEGWEDKPGTVELVEQAISENVDIKTLVVDGLTAGMTEVGTRFESGIYLIPDMLASAEAVGEAMNILAPHLEHAGIESKGKFVIATVAGDLHDIGKNIVAIMLKGAGLEVIDLGTDVKADKIVDAVVEHKPLFLGLSALLTTTMREMENVINKLDGSSVRDSVQVLIGGAPTSAEFAEKIGADLYCADAFSAVSVVKEGIGE
jgi:5-methyltetrahydrofolate--homocysteine methyltransferase